MHADCLFCSIPEERVIAECELAFVVRDGFPVTALHTLVLPKRHVRDYFGLTDSELMAMHRHLTAQRTALLGLDPSIEGFNIGANCGEVAGQTIWHCHLHLIPRRRGDVEKPRGGVRHVIPGKGAY
jgi:ATP adenylyltransferase